MRFYAKAQRRKDAKMCWALDEGMIFHPVTSRRRSAQYQTHQRARCPPEVAERGSEERRPKGGVVRRAAARLAEEWSRPPGGARSEPQASPCNSMGCNKPRLAPLVCAPVVSGLKRPGEVLRCDILLA